VISSAMGRAKAEVTSPNDYGFLSVFNTCFRVYPYRSQVICVFSSLVKKMAICRFLSLGRARTKVVSLFDSSTTVSH
jgi:hypothetical protein